MEPSRLSSKDNPRIKHLRKLLTDKAYRYQTTVYIVEGMRALGDARDVVELYIREDVPAPDRAVPVYVVAREVFERLSDTENSQGILAVARLRRWGPERIRKDGRYVLLDSLQDPGNMGSVVRSACAFGMDGVIVTPGCVDPFSPKVVRASAGSIGKLDIIHLDDLRSLSEFTLIVADLEGEDVARVSWPRHFILCVGNEARGVSEIVRGMAEMRVTVPVTGAVESLNAAVAAAIILYCAGGTHGEKK